MAALVQLRRSPQSCSATHATATARIARWASTRRLRHAATALLQSTLLSARAPIAHGVTLLLEGLQLCVQTVHARAAASGTQADCPDSAWQAAVMLSALWHTLHGRYMPMASPAAEARSAA